MDTEKYYCFIQNTFMPSFPPETLLFFLQDGNENAEVRQSNILAFPSLVSAPYIFT